MDGIIELKLKVFRDFQLANPTAHLGGSLGLMLRGVDLLRNLSKSDLDVTIDEYDAKNLEKDALELSSDFNDFDFCTRKGVSANGNYVKMDIRVTPEPSFEKVLFDGFEYNVSKLRDILFWKKKYAQKGVLKHVNDLIAIETGVRPSDIVENDFPW